MCDRTNRNDFLVRKILVRLYECRYPYYETVFLVRVTLQPLYIILYTCDRVQGSRETSFTLELRYHVFTFTVKMCRYPVLTSNTFEFRFSTIIYAINY